MLKNTEVAYQNLRQAKDENEARMQELDTNIDSLNRDRQDVISNLEAICQALEVIENRLVNVAVPCSPCTVSKRGY